MRRAAVVLGALLLLLGLPRCSSGPAPIRIGATTLKTPVDGYHAYANVAAVGNLITVAWIADGKGALKARAIDLSGTSPIAAATRANWDVSVALAGHVSLRQGGYPIVSASPLVPGVVTIAWNTARRQVYTTFDGSAVTATPTTVWIDGTANATTYAGGYSTVVEPAPGGFIAMWAGCEETSLIHDCNSAKRAARVEMPGCSRDRPIWSSRSGRRPPGGTT